MKRNFVMPTLQDLPQTAKAILDFIGERKILAFYGDLGAGKTTFIQSFCCLLGVREKVLSPTFAIVNEYLAKDMEAVYHFDFYRINHIREALSIGYEEYIRSGAYCLMEWSERIEELIPKEAVSLRFTVQEGEQRSIEVEFLEN